MSAVRKTMVAKVFLASVMMWSSKTALRLAHLDIPREFTGEGVNWQTSNYSKIKNNKRLNSLAIKLSQFL